MYNRVAYTRWYTTEPIRETRRERDDPKEKERLTTNGISLVGEKEMGIGECILQIRNDGVHSIREKGEE